jgi:hypothetical protein
MSAERRPVIFISYSHRDKGVKDRLVTHIGVLPGVQFELWDDSKIQIGEDWQRGIREALGRADAGVLLISADFLTSEFIKSKELPALLPKPLYPILIGYCAWEQVPWLARLQMLTDNGKPLGTRGQKLDKGLLVVATEMARLYAPPEAAPAPPPPAPVAPRATAADLHIEVYDPFVAIVIQKDQRTGPAFNLRFRVVNQAGRAVTLPTLQIALTDPYGTSFKLEWTVFFEGELVHKKTDDAHPISLQGRSKQILGIQFVGPSSIAHAQWPPGQYLLDLIARETTKGPGAVLTRCEMTVTAANARDLFYWARAGAAQWEALGDPDNAVGIPVSIARRAVE